MTDEVALRERIGDVAVSWLSTPFHDEAQVKGAGVDCATLLKAVFEEAGVLAPFELEHYSPTHFMHSTEERYIEWIERCGGIEISQDQAKPGDIVLYKPKAALCFCHGALIIEPGWPNIIHAHYAARCVRRDNGLRPRLGSPIEAMKFFTLFDESKKKSSP